MGIIPETGPKAADHGMEIGNARGADVGTLVLRVPAFFYPAFDPLPERGGMLLANCNMSDQKPVCAGFFV